MKDIFLTIIATFVIAIVVFTILLKTPQQPTGEFLSKEEVKNKTESKIKPLIVDEWIRQKLNMTRCVKYFDDCKDSNNDGLAENHFSILTLVATNITLEEGNTTDFNITSKEVK